MSYEKKQAIVRFEVGKARLDQILKPYAGSGYDVTPTGPVVTIVRDEHVTVRAWADPTEVMGVTAEGQEHPPDAAIYVEFVPVSPLRFTAPPTLMPPQNLSDLGLKRVRDVAEISAADAKPPLAPGAQRFSLSLRPHKRIAPGSLSLHFSFRCAIQDSDGKQYGAEGKVPVLLDAVATGTDASPAQAAVALVGGSFDLALGHLCDQEGCVDHLHKSLGSTPGLVGVRPLPSLADPRATVFVQADRPIDVWSLRERLRQQGLELRQLVPRDFRRFELQVELCRWQDVNDSKSASPCKICRNQTLAAVQSLAWTSEAILTGCGVTIRTRDMNADVCIPLDKLEETGIAPVAVWLVPQGVTAPEPALPRARSAAVAPKTLGSESHPLIQFDLGHDDGDCPDFMNALVEQAWASRTGVHKANLGAINPHRVLPETDAVAALGDRQRADLVPLFHTWQTGGRRPTRVQLTGFGDLRVQLEFAHLCGEVEYSKPPKKPDGNAAQQKPGDEKPQNDKGAPDANTTNDATPTAKSGDEPKSASDQTNDESKKDAPKQATPEEKPFVPRPIRPAPSSNARQAIERAIATVAWVEQGTYLDYHTKPEFDGPRTLTITLRPAGDGAVRLDELTRAVRRAGFPPTAVRVSRLFPGIPFGHALPPDMELDTAGGERRLVSSYYQAGRPLAIAFVSLYCPNWDKYNYEADPKLFAKFKELIDSYQNRVDFVAISSDPDDKLVEVAECLERADIRIPLLNDPHERARAIFNAQITPPPHLFVFDADGLLRYAGDPHSNWNKPSEEQKDFLGPALDAVIAGEFAANGAVSFHSPKCNCSSPNCKCPKCGCGPSCRCDIGHCKVGF